MSRLTRDTGNVLIYMYMYRTETKLYIYNTPTNILYPFYQIPGPYLKTDEIRHKFSEGFRKMTEAFLSFPLCIPYITNVWKGKMGRYYIF